MLNLMRRPDAATAGDVMLIPQGEKMGRLEKHTVTRIVDEFLTFIPPDLLPAFKGGLDRRFEIQVEGRNPAKPEAAGEFLDGGVRPAIKIYLDADGMGNPAMVKRALFHELGHWLEYLAGPWASGFSGMAKAKLTDWIKAKDAHFRQRARKLELSPEGYLLGGFYLTYTGRRYPGKPDGMELVSTHLELLAHPEHLEFALSSRKPGASASNTIETLLLLCKLFE